MKVKEFIKDEKLNTSNNLIKKPVVSIIMPTYCRGDSGLLERSINTVLNQTFKVWELIIVDDGSMDSTSNIVRNFMKNDNRIIYIRNDVNSGLPAIRVNQGIIKSRGRYIAYQFDDDQWVDNMLEIMLDKLKKMDSLAFVYGKGRFINSITKEERVHGEKYDEQIMIKKGNQILNNSVVHSRELPYLYGVYNPHVAMRRLCDWDLWRRWSKHIDLTFIDEIVSIVEYSHKDSISMNTDRNNYVVEEMQKRNMEKELSLYNIEEYEVDNVNIISNKSIQDKIIKNDISNWKSKLKC